ncbi:MAG: hypothetical protein GWN01_06110 [Nitrosopumilaceae archaeon]|nr:hypothetical protein [Nitrosopumilaceae archaeon]NIU00512.1 hypothetical protein [Nitrosopumilaceae archaeon]NIU86895.1 hypothetical protein [Nitrosopumilaceae archaeon]NIV65575.1 hypothetical protein [Nitrosopumilaceae archaeon]NIX61114.1 hypothetical protein [Nitrosopumilaceae archaeon]
MAHDLNKIVESMFDPIISGLVAELEDGEKSANYLATKMDITENEVKTKLDYLITCGFIIFDRDRKSYSADSVKLNKFIEEHNNFDSTVDSLTKMDSYLN